jgi:hypothetical protein
VVVLFTVLCAVRLFARAATFLLIVSIRARVTFFSVAASPKPMPLVEDLLNPSQSRQLRSHKLKRLVQSPNR